eukprot:6982628-Alexandrium_andersonii.AAC.1
MFRPGKGRGKGGKPTAPEAPGGSVSTAAPRAVGKRVVLPRGGVGSATKSDIAHQSALRIPRTPNSRRSSRP